MVLPSLEVLFFENLHSSNVSLFNEIDIKSIYSVNSALEQGYFVTNKYSPENILII